MKNSLIENMLTGFRTAHDARIAAAQLRQSAGVSSAVYYDPGNDMPGDLTKYDGCGHCVRLVMVQEDNRTIAALVYHRVQVVALNKAYTYALGMTESEHDAGRHSASDTWHQIAEGLDSALHYHGQFVTALGGEE